MSAELEAERSFRAVTLIINGKRVRARPGQTVLEVVREQNLDDIPTLCYDPRLEPYGSCFLCVVEVKGSPRLVPACVTRVRDGMDVTTRSERIVNTRRAALNLLLSDHYADCVCPAQNGCPAGVDIQGYLGLAGLGHYAEALALIKNRNPLPVVCGRVCVRKCELKCRRSRVDEPIGINFVKRYVAEHASAAPAIPEDVSPTGKRVAVVGGGPAGLCCANYLALKGHAVTIFEALPKLGGMLRYGIPEYRLPRAELDAEIRGIVDLGIEVRTSKTLGKDFAIETLLRAEGFQAVFLALGAQLGKRMGIPGEERARGVRTALEFLRSIELDGPPVLHGKVVVVGGGNSAIDAARSALRCGAEEVTILYRRTRNEMPAYAEEVDAAETEGVTIELLVAPHELVIGRDGHVKGILCHRMSLGAPDASGRRAPVPIEGSEIEFACDEVFAAIGQDTDLALLQREPEEMRPGVSRKSTLVADPRSMATTVKGVFAGGDLVIGPSAVIDAIAHGRMAAEAIDTYLTTGKVKESEGAFLSRRGDLASLPDWLFEDVPRSSRSVMPVRPPRECVRDFAPVENGLSESEARREARRCMECGCSAIFKCKLRRYAADYGVDVSKFAGESRRHRVDHTHPLITLDPNKCILCGKCIRTCSEIVGLSILGFMGRGFGTAVRPARGASMGESACIACGACAESCPTGAIAARLPAGRQGPWRSRPICSVCNFCSIGCELDLNVAADGLLWVSSHAAATGSSNELCWKGRFGCGLIHGTDRLTTPLVRRDGKWAEVPWDDAIQSASQVLAQYRDRPGADPITTLVSPCLTLEEAVLVRHLAREALGGAPVGSFGQNRRGGPRHDLDELLGETSSTCLREDLEDAEMILLSGADPSVSHPSLAMDIRRAARRGAAIVVVNSSRIDLLRADDLWLDARRGTAGILYAAITNDLLKKAPATIPAATAGAVSALRSSVSFATLEFAARLTGINRVRIQTFAEWLASKRKIVAIYDLENSLERAVDDLLGLAQVLALTGRIGEVGQGLLLLESGCNSAGARLAGIANPLHLDEVSGALIIGENPCADFRTARELGRFQPLVVIDRYLTETAQRAAVVLPAATLAESTGTVITFDRKIKAVRAACRPPSGLTTAEIIARIARALGIRIPAIEPRVTRMDIAASLGMEPVEFEVARERGGVLPHRPVAPLVLSPLRLDTTATDASMFPYDTLDFMLANKAAAWGLTDHLQGR